MRHCAVARVNSGENAGHTVIGANKVKYDFHLCPSGILTEGKVNCIGPECVMDPVSFMQREISQLVDTNVRALITQEHSRGLKYHKKYRVSDTAVFNARSNGCE
jgi:adenylosuccinate synthase